MATQYTSLLGLALPVTGELSGSWGDVVNDSITSLLDSAISGTTSITTDADTTLTTTTGAANQARQAIILWNPASGTVTRNITAPAQSKIYTVINASGGTQSIVFRGAGPTTGVTIVKGESAVVAWNGTDFIKISNAGGSASFTNVTVTGTTTLSGLTASTALALDASKNVVSVTNTGTGNNVLSASPTLTGTLAAAAATFSGAVALGDAAADNITVNGTVTSNLIFTDNTYDIGASGATRPRNLFLAGNATVGGNIVLTGSLDLTNLEVTNIKAKDGTAGMQIADSTGVVSFTANPVLSGGTANGVTYLNGSKVLTTGSALTFDGTNLGIGTSSPGAKLDVVGGATSGAVDVAAFFRGGVAGVAGSGAAINLCGGSLTTRAARIEGVNTSGSSNAHAMVFSTSAAAEAPTERMRIDSAGSVGIGTSSPVGILDVLGSNASHGNTGIPTTPTLRLQRNTTDAANYAGLVINTNASNSDFGLYSNQNGALFYYGGIERLRITSTNTVFIGNGSTDASPADGRLSATGGSGTNIAGATLTIRGGASTGSGAGGPIVFSTAAAGASGTTVRAATERMRITSAGNVGIGTSSPAFRLNVLGEPSADNSRLPVIQNGTSDTSYAGFWVNRESSGGRLGFELRAMFGAGNVGNGSGFSTGDGRQFIIYGGSNNTEAVRITSTGNVGIGTSSPSASAILDAQSTTKGVRMPNMTTTQKNAIASPAAGLMVFDTTLAKLCVYTGAAWETITSL